MLCVVHNTFLTGFAGHTVFFFGVNYNFRPRNLLLKNDAKPLNDKALHDKLDIQDTGCSFLVAGC